MRNGHDNGHTRHVTSGVLKALTIAGFNAAASCRKDPKAVFLVLRTELNTPSFLLGHHWSLVQAIGKEMADAQIRKSPTPGALIIFRDRQVWLPSSVLTATPEIVAKLIAQEVTSDESLFSCCMCGKTFVESREDAFIRVSEMGVAPCGKMFRRACVKPTSRKPEHCPTSYNESVLRITAKLCNSVKL